MKVRNQLDVKRIGDRQVTWSENPQCEIRSGEKDYHGVRKNVEIYFKKGKTEVRFQVLAQELQLAIQNAMNCE